MPVNRLPATLDKEHVDYEVLPHRRDVMAQETAEDTHTPGLAFAKSVVLEAGKRRVLAVLPASKRVNLDRAAAALGEHEVHLAGEDAMEKIFADCEVGAEPPFGNLYGLEVYVDPALAANEVITFNGGTHREAIRMRYEDFARLVKPEPAVLSE
ncbi:MAG: aminoacyl-tRNA deacylase [Planctomycetota bacterium]|jgi:Ala-tRNA(Pro) deacylase